MSQQESLDGIIVKLDYIQRSQDDLKTDIKDVKKQISDGYVTKADLISMDTRVTKIESVLEWAGRLIVGAIILAVIGLLLSRK